MKRCGAPLPDGSTCRQRVADDQLACWRPGHKVAQARWLADDVRRVERERKRRPEPTFDLETLVTPITDRQVEQVCATLDRHGVRYVLIGGVGLQLQGVPTVRSVDSDITPERSQENLARLAAALVELHARIRSREDARGLAFDIHPSIFEHRPFLNLVTDAGPLDVVLEPEGVDGYAELVQHVVDVRVGNTIARVAAVEDIAKSKEAAGRPKDIALLPTIRRFLHRRPS